MVVGLHSSHVFGVFISDLFFAFSKISKVLIRVFNHKTPHSKANVVQISETALNQFPFSFIHK